MSMASTAAIFRSGCQNMTAAIFAACASRRAGKKERDEQAEKMQCRRVGETEWHAGDAQAQPPAQRAGQLIHPAREPRRQEPTGRGRHGHCGELGANGRVTRDPPEQRDGNDHAQEGPKKTFHAPGTRLRNGQGRQLGFRVHGGIFQPAEPSLATSNTLAKGVPRFIGSGSTVKPSRQSDVCQSCRERQ